MFGLSRSCVWLAAWVISAACQLGSADAADGKPLTFEADIRPIFRSHCYDCHGSEKEKKGKLDLRLARFMLAGGETGPAIVAGDPNKSFLVQRLTEGSMPPGDDRVSALTTTTAAIRVKYRTSANTRRFTLAFVFT